MYVQQLYTNCLAEAAYYIESAGEAAIIDPVRETDQYLELAAKRGAKIKYIFETHFHADFVSGHLDLAKKTRAKIIYGPGAVANYDITVAADKENFKLGELNIKVLHTPGHTLESSCFLLMDNKNNPYACFTGDTLFVGDVGRPDLAVKSSLSREDLAGLLYDSIRTKILSLPDDVIVYPGHGAGSACGKNIGKETWSTIGMQKKLNYALQPMSRDEFISSVTNGLTDPPKYFFIDALINKKGYDPLEDVMAKNSRSLTVEQLEHEIGKGAIILDTREAEVFEKGFIPGSINIGLNGQYAIWAGSLLDLKDTLVLVTEEGHEKEAVLRLARIGYENVKGYLQGGIQTWIDAGKATDQIPSMLPIIFESRYETGENILDVRRESEWESGIVTNAKTIPLTKLEQALPTLDKNEKYYVYCARGFRSMIACSIMKKNGFKNIVNISGGINLIRKTTGLVGLPGKVYSN